jgi:hypothetical protein
MSAAGIWVGEAVTPDPMDISTGFEFSDADGFTMGTAPFTVDFQGGVTQTIGNATFYHDGVFSWHISSAGASIVFGVPVESVSLWTRTTTNGDVATIQVLDEFRAQISSTAVTDNFVQIVEIPGMGAPLIGSVVITVAAGDGNIYAPPGESLVDGSTVAPLTISTGTVVEDASLDVTIVSSGLAIDVTTTFDALYDRGADLATVAAVYTTFDIFGDMSSFIIDADGVISGNSATGCVLNGQASVIDAAVNAYDVNLVVTNVGTCNALVGDYDGLAASADTALMDGQFVLTVFVDGQMFIVGNAVK